MDVGCILYINRVEFGWVVVVDVDGWFGLEENIVEQNFFILFFSCVHNPSENVQQQKKNGKKFFVFLNTHTHTHTQRQGFFTKNCLLLVRSCTQSKFII